MSLRILRSHSFKYKSDKFFCIISIHFNVRILDTFQFFCIGLLQLVFFKHVRTVGFQYQTDTPSMAFANSCCLSNNKSNVAALHQSFFPFWLCMQSCMQKRGSLCIKRPWCCLQPLDPALSPPWMTLDHLLLRANQSDHVAFHHFALERQSVFFCTACTVPQ